MKEDLATLQKQFDTFVVQECEIWSRVVGYYRQKSAWNPGKLEEDRQRVNYKLGPDLN